MLYRLTKVSSPGWDKDFLSEGEACVELRAHICKSCMLGEMEYIDPDAEGGIGIDRRPPPDPAKIHDLLGTPCGCEFWLEEDPTKPLQQS